MKLTPKEMDRLLIFTAAELARKRKGKQLKLNQPESMALICDEMHEAAREGKTYEEVISLATNILGREEVMDGVAGLIEVIKLEVVFPDGTRLITVRNPIR